jgi:hypothetical protein
MRTRFALAIAAGLVFSVPAFPAQPVANSYDVCLLRIAHGGGYYTSLDDGTSALALMHQCDIDRADWVVRCVAGDPDKYTDCLLKSSMRALLAVVAIEDLRAFGRPPETGDRP